ncbi:hypothetical protein [Fructobacillus papyrifericola]|uniref:Phage protein n=1 Tax=Fructobacillus papyrifericola TaxID=2713172 RepID=A0ABS5QTA2_9LACO|nr:hypothetical protein [Fructobacillus papyrifericola]MBS9336428.1 hypothetical protein [Fructobacillus papyrifericola]
MTKKFTEEEYQKIVDLFDKFNKFNREDNMGILNPSVTIHFQEELGNDFNLINDWSEIVAIMNPRTRDGAHEQFVEKENRYFWRYKNPNVYNVFLHLNKAQGIVRLSYLNRCPLTEKEIIETGYNPDMFDKEEVK